MLIPTSPGLGRWALRARNIGLFDWSIWDPQQPSLVAELRDPTARCENVVSRGDNMLLMRMYCRTPRTHRWVVRVSEEGGADVPAAWATPRGL